MGDCIVLSAEPEGACSDVGLFFLNHVLYENINKLELFSHSFLIRSTSMCEISSQLLQALTNVYEKNTKMPEVDGSCLFFCSDRNVSVVFVFVCLFFVGVLCICICIFSSFFVLVRLTRLRAVVLQFRSRASFISYTGVAAFLIF